MLIKLIILIILFFSLVIVLWYISKNYVHLGGFWYLHKNKKRIGQGFSLKEIIYLHRQKKICGFNVQDYTLKSMQEALKSTQLTIGEVYSVETHSGVLYHLKEFQNIEVIEKKYKRKRILLELIQFIGVFEFIRLFFRKDLFFKNLKRQIRKYNVSFYDIKIVKH